MKKRFSGISLLLFLSQSIWAQDWRTADRSPLGIMPVAAQEPQAVVQVYAARAFAWRGYFAVHPWVVVKKPNATEYDVYEVVGFRRAEGIPVVRKSNRAPDSRWFGSDPNLIYDLRGPAAEEMIPKVEAAIATYPHSTSYRLYPGPNSNTFVAHVIRHTPGMTVELPPNAIGKDWINDGDLFGLSESGTGVQFSIFGLFGFTLGLGEGIEINILGLTFGIDFWSPALKLPFVGRLGFKDRPVYTPKASEKPKVPEASAKEASLR